jgi:protein-tyrosine-phosphatase
VVLKTKLAAAGLSPADFPVASSGTSGHRGWCADPRTTRVALAAGYAAIADHRGRPLCDDDFSGLLLGLDKGHLRELHESARAGKLPCNARLAMDFAGFSAGALRKGVDVGDPYYEDDCAFPAVLKMCEDSADGVVAALQRCRALNIRAEGGALMAALMGDLEALRTGGGGSGGGAAAR